MTGYPPALPAGGGKDVSMAKAEPVPVSVITGFLGSGKTTLLLHLLRRPDMGLTAVIINEFCEVGLALDLVSSPTAVTKIGLAHLCTPVTISHLLFFLFLFLFYFLPPS